MLIVPTLITQKSKTVNEKVVDYVQSVMGTQIGRGECSDLIMQVQYIVFKEKPTKKTKKPPKVLPGDIISLYNVSIGGLYFSEHYAIIMEEISPQVYRIAHQNHNGYKKVHEITIDLKEAAGGKYYIKRPK